MDADDFRLAAQYEALPYPQRNPAEERRRLVLGSPSHLREVDHYVFGARRPRSQPLAVLVAGGGTGDATIMLAEQMRALGQPGSITHLDRSAAAIAVARARAEIRGLQVRFVQGSLLELAGWSERFDYVDCCGVLHHLPDPAAGLVALESVMAPGGGMGLMVYAPHGRTGVYMVQDALRLLAPAGQPEAARLDTARRVLRHLPERAWLRQNRSVTDHLAGGDPGLFDLLLNPRDRAFTVPDLLGLLRSAGLSAAALVEPLRYDPAAHLPDPRLRRLAAALPWAEQAALAEALSGTMSTHVAYVSRAPMRPEMTDEAVPVAREVPAEELARRIRPDGTYAFVCEALEVPIPLPRQAALLLHRVDGRRPVAEVAAGHEAAWRETYARLSAANLLLLAPPP